MECDRVISPSVVRLRVASDGAIGVPATVIAKATARGGGGGVMASKPEWVESTIHAMLSEHGAPIPELYWSGYTEDGRYWVQVTEDLAAHGEVFDHTYRWSQDQIEAVAEALAELHAAGNRVDKADLKARHPWVTNDCLNRVDGGWLSGLSARLGDFVSTDRIDSVGPVLDRVAERYDEWLSDLSGLTTIIHSDVHYANLSLTHVSDSRWRARLLDLGASMLGLPQYDLLVFEQRDWNADIDWKPIRELHHRKLVSLRPALACYDSAWDWCYDLALLQLMLAGTCAVIGVLDQGDEAGPSDRAWAERIRLFDDEFLRACGRALGTDYPIPG